MGDVSPGIALSAFAAVIGGLLKVAGEIIKWRAARRIKRAYEQTAPSETPAVPFPPVAPAPVAASAELQLHQKEIELLRARYEVEELEQAMRRMRRALDDGASEQAALAAALSRERMANEQLVRELEEMRRHGGEPVPRAYRRGPR